MKRVVVPGLVVLLAAGLIGLLAYGLTARTQDSTLDQALADGRRPVAPSAVLPLLGERGTRSVAQLRGQVVVLNFWASWCGPCVAEAPVLERAHERLRGSGAGTVLGVTFDDASADSMAFVRRYAISFPSVRDVGTRFAKRYGVSYVPETFVIDRRGRIVDLRRGPIDQAFVDRALARARVR